jgi:hypothetical protein
MLANMNTSGRLENTLQIETKLEKVSEADKLVSFPMKLKISSLRV